MNIKDWQQIKSFSAKKVELGGIWLLVVDYIAAGKILKLKAEGEWSFLPGHAQQCDPNGFLGFPLPDEKLLLSTTALGALIGKLGGSTADQKDGTVFAIGTFAMVTVPTTTPGPLFVTINSARGARVPVLERLDLKVEISDP
jgi:hypothetical protein